MSVLLAHFKDSAESFARTFTANRIVWLSVAAGLCCGFLGIGIPPMLLHFQEILSDCTQAKSKIDCTNGGVQPNICVWDAAHSVCLGPSTICDPKWIQSRCHDASLCKFSAERNQCEQSRGWGWTNLELGFFAAATVIGAVVGTLVASATAKHEQVKRVSQCSMTACIGAVLAWLSWIFTSHHAILPSLCFIIVGVGFGFLMTTAPAIVSSVVSPSIRALCGTIFQLAITLAICLSSLFALILESSPNIASHVLFIVGIASAGVTFWVAETIASPIVVSFLADDVVAGGDGGENEEFGDENGIGGGIVSGDQQPPVEAGPGGSGGGGGGGPPVESAPPGGSAASIEMNDTSSLVVRHNHLNHSSSSSSLFSSRQNRNSNNNSTTPASTAVDEFNKNCYTCGYLLALSLQTSGINAIMSFSPKIMQSVGIYDPLKASFLICFVNMITCLPAIPLSSRYPSASLYTAGLAGAAVCLFLTAAAMMIKSAVLALFAVCLFILCFEAAMGPLFFTLMTEIFDPKIRTVAVGRINFLNFFVTIVIVWGYPALCEWMMPVGEPNGGVRRSFVLFGFLSAACCVALHYKFPQTFLRHKVTTPPSEALGVSDDEENNENNQNQQQGSGVVMNQQHGERTSAVIENLDEIEEVVVDRQQGQFESE